MTLAADIDATLKQIIDTTEGWCTLYKAQRLFQCTLSPEVNLAVEVGIYAGKSILPIGLAFKAKGSGQAYGVEPWSNSVAVETVTDPANDEWWSKLDFGNIKRHFLQEVLDHDLLNFIRIIELPSDAAINALISPRFVGKVDLVHIDGAHSVEQSVFDVAFWTRITSPKATIFLDDINWPSVGLAAQYLKETCDLVEWVDDLEKGHFAVFRKR